MNSAIVVTGAGSGIGREIARRAARDGSFMLLADARPGPLAEITAELVAGGAEAHALAINLLDTDAGERIEGALSERDLYCDVLVNSAGLGLYGLAAEIDRGAQINLFNVNARVLTELTLRFLPGMVRRGRGGVLNLGSIAGYAPGPKMAVYHATKAYVRFFSTALAAEVAGTGVTVTCLIPGMVRTPFLDALPMRNYLFEILAADKSGPHRGGGMAWLSGRKGRGRATLVRPHFSGACAYLIGPHFGAINSCLSAPAASVAAAGRTKHCRHRQLNIERPAVRHWWLTEWFGRVAARQLGLAPLRPIPRYSVPMMRSQKVKKSPKL